MESVEGSEKVARYSFLGSMPSLVFRTKAKDIEIIQNGKIKKIKSSNPLGEIKRLMQQYRFVQVSGLPRFCGGLVGFIHGGHTTVPDLLLNTILAQGLAGQIHDSTHLSKTSASSRS